jgi:ABC-type transport system substrate-binding protein
MTILKIVVAALALTAATAAQAQRSVESEYGQGIRESALAFSVQNQPGGYDPSNAYVGGNRLAGRLYDEPRYENRPVYRSEAYRPIERRYYRSR